MKMPFSDNTFDAIFAIEATCHAPDVVCHKGSLSRLMIFSVLSFSGLAHLVVHQYSFIYLFFKFNFLCSLFCEWSRLIVTKRYTEC